MILYVNGDSYTTGNIGERYSDFLGDLLGCPSINTAINGSSNGRILRTTLRDLLELKKTHTDITAVISLSFLVRTEIWDNETQPDKWKHSNDGEFASYNMVTSKDWYQNRDTNPELSTKLNSFAKNWITWYNVEAETTRLLQQSLLLVNWLQNNNIKYVLFSSCLQETVDVVSPFIKPFYDELFSDPQVLNFFNQSFTEFCLGRKHEPIDHHLQEIHGITKNIGHHGAPAHKDFANHLFENYLKL